MSTLILFAVAVFLIIVIDRIAKITAKHHILEYEKKKGLQDFLNS